VVAFRGNLQATPASEVTQFVNPGPLRGPQPLGTRGPQPLGTRDPEALGAGGRKSSESRVVSNGLLVFGFGFLDARG
jgi:hypothetical protein